MAAEDVVNKALILMGDPVQITSLSENTTIARTANAIYDSVRKAELRKHEWNFARKSVTVNADGVAPDAATGYGYRYSLPSDFLRLVSTDENLDWQISENFILSDDSGSIKLTYIKDVTDTDLWDATFFEVMAVTMALKLTPVRLKSNTTKQITKQDYRDAIADARRANAFERKSQEPEEDTWVSVRR